MMFCPSSADWGSVADWAGGLLTGAGIIAAVVLAGRPERDRRRQEQVARRALAQFTALKLRGMMSSVELIVGHFATSRPATWPDDARIDRWRWIKHPIGMEGDAAVRIEQSELLTFLDGGQAEFAGKLALYSRRYASLFELVREYRKMRSELEALPVENDDVDGTLLRGSVAWQPSARADALSAALEDEVTLIADRGAELIAEGNALAAAFTRSARVALKEPKFLVEG
ncbi:MULTISPECIES: hypothetical protein [unclassified Sphingomonas]|uniref:hypothetical protein n=1 Tax=unclassified Sphingomonas TaxID=196159 RepID=UPI00226A0201|nr:MULTISPECIES: hypothetical protein [unclassified Sphingomonas]